LPNIAPNSFGPNSYYKTKIGADYYDEAGDAQKRAGYYQPVADSFEKSDPRELFGKLHDHLKNTHDRLDELPADILYSTVDRRPDGALYYLYSGDGPKAEEQAPVRETRDLTQYNIEHVVPKSWFEAQLPMRDDLHHLFTEQRHCNSQRGNLPLREVESGAKELKSCGLLQESHGKAFEPKSGKGEAARAILYFVTRHPGLLGDSSKEMTSEDLPKLLEWHREYPVTDYERHRNTSIQDSQGNRNPFIDFPELAAKVDFSLGFADR
jgi:hypothetical protein